MGEFTGGCQEAKIQEVTHMSGSKTSQHSYTSRTLSAPTLEDITQVLVFFQNSIPTMDIGKFLYQRAASYSQHSVALLDVTVSNACLLGSSQSRRCSRKE